MKYNDSKNVIIECEVLHLTERAVQIMYHNDDDKKMFVWLPLSQCEAPDTIMVGDEEITIPRWLAEDRNLPRD